MPIGTETVMGTETAQQSPLVRLADLAAKQLPPEYALMYHMARPLLLPMLHDLEQHPRMDLYRQMMESGMGYLAQAMQQAEAIERQQTEQQRATEEAAAQQQSQQQAQEQAQRQQQYRTYPPHQQPHQQPRQQSGDIPTVDGKPQGSHTYQQREWRPGGTR